VTVSEVRGERRLQFGKPRFRKGVVRMRVYTYARYSTERQTEASIVDQQRRCHLYAVSRGWAVIADFTDEGISGAALGNRPGFQQAMAALQAGDVLLAADLTRLSRSQELAPLLDRLRFRGAYASLVYSWV
jgi:site-specific DNA recombinase